MVNPEATPPKCSPNSWHFRDEVTDDDRKVLWIYSKLKILHESLSHLPFFKTTVDVRTDFATTSFWRKLLGQSSLSLAQNSWEPNIVWLEKPPWSPCIGNPFWKKRWKLKIPDIFIGQKDSKKGTQRPKKNFATGGNYGCILWARKLAKRCTWFNKRVQLIILVASHTNPYGSGRTLGVRATTICNCWKSEGSETRSLLKLKRIKIFFYRRDFMGFLPKSYTARIAREKKTSMGGFWWLPLKLKDCIGTRPSTIV